MLTRLGSANVVTKDLIGTLIYWVIFVGLIFVKPYKLHYLFSVSFVGVSLTIVGMFIWSLAANGGAGDLVAPPVELSKRCVYGPCWPWPRDER